MPELARGHSLRDEIIRVTFHVRCAKGMHEIAHVHFSTLCAAIINYSELNMHKGAEKDHKQCHC